MKALIYRQGTPNLALEEVDNPSIDAGNPADEHNVILKIAYTGLCGTDKHIWAHDPSTDARIRSGMNEMGKDWLLAGHELFGRVVEVGPKVTRVKKGDFVSAESHLVCGECKQCRSGQTHVCVNEKIIGVTTDGCFAEYCKLPESTLWVTDIARMDPMLAAVQEPFGNAVHTCQTVDLKGRTVAIFGCGTIGLMSVIIAKGFGASKVIAVEPNEHNLNLAGEVGTDEIVHLDLSQVTKSGYHESLVKRIKSAAGGGGVDVALEMSGHNDSINNAIRSVRRGGDVMCFGIPSGSQPVVIDDYSTNIIFKGVTLHGIVGRRVFETWEHTKRLLETPEVAARMRKLVLPEAYSFADYRAAFEEGTKKFPKVVIEWGGMK